MRLRFEEVGDKLGPSSPFKRSAVLRVEDGDVRAVTAEIREWCFNLWGDTVSFSEARNGYFPESVVWFESGSRFWFSRDEHYFEFKLRWQGADALPPVLA